MIHLTERFDGKEVYLIGTANSSTMLAQRTKKLIQELKPDTVLVQANEEWWARAKLLRFVDSQEEFSSYTKYLNKTGPKWLEYYWNSRKFIFLARYAMYYTAFQAHFRFGHDFQFWQPGLEVKYACESAEQVGASLKFLGPELNHVTYERLYHETRANVTHYLYRLWTYLDSYYYTESKVNRQKIAMTEPAQFTEKCLDRYLMNWYIQTADVFFPKVKEIFVDKRDEDLFTQIDKSDGKKIVVLVNQWHMEGIEHNWCFRHGQYPRSVNFQEPINPIGDMDLRPGLFQRMFNYLQREVKSSQQRSTPSTYADWIIGYHRESNFQYEHRDM